MLVGKRVGKGREARYISQRRKLEQMREEEKEKEGYIYIEREGRRGINGGCKRMITRK